MNGWDIRNLNDIHGLFWNCQTIEEIHMQGWNVSNITEQDGLYGLFYQNINLKILDIPSDWKIKTPNINYLFYRCSNLSEDFSEKINDWKFDKLNVEMSNTFTDCKFKPKWANENN